MTRDTEKAFVIIYAEYLHRRSFGTAKYEAVRFQSAKLRAIEAFSTWDSEDIRYCLNELRKLGYVKLDIIGDMTLQESGIEYMENKPGDYFKMFVNVVKDLIPLVSVFRPA